MLTYLLNYYAHMLRALAQHVELLFLTLVLAIPISFVLGLLIYRYRFLSAPILIVTELLYTIPSLAFFALLIPFSGLGTRTAVIVLICYALFFLIRNFLEGLYGIDPQIVEAGKAMGYSPFALFFRIELPLAMPAIIAGARMATVSTIGIGCIAYAIGAGGIGTILFEGMRQLSYVKILWGALLAVLLSVCANQILMLCERYFSRQADPGRN